jgi:hypothetical protein
MLVDELRPRRRWYVVTGMAVAALLVAGVAPAALLAGDVAWPAAAAAPAPSPSPSPAAAAGPSERDFASTAHRAITDALGDMSAALLRGDRAAFLAVGAPGDKALAGELRRRFTSLRALRIAELYLTIESGVTRAAGAGNGGEWTATVAVDHCFGSPGCALEQVAVQTRWQLTVGGARLLRIATVDDDDYGPMPWEVSALTVAVGKRVIVAGAARASRVRAIVDRVDRAAAVADTYAVGRTPERYLVFLAGPKEFATWYGGASDWAGGFAAAATAGRTDVVINIDEVSGDDLDFVLRHELTHASTLHGSDFYDEDSSSWLIEGIADQAGYHGLPVPPAVVWTEARRYIRENKWAGDLDPLVFEDDEPDWQITAKYDIGFLAVRRLTEKYGRARVRTFFDAVIHQGRYHEQAARSAFGVGWEAIGKDVGRSVKRRVGA